MLDVINLRKNHQQLFWNLIYRFMLEKRDHMFILPYDIDLFPDSYKEDMNSYEMQIKSPKDKLNEVMEDHKEETSKSSIPIDDMKANGFEMTLQPHKRKELIGNNEKVSDLCSSDEGKDKSNNNIRKIVTPDESKTEISRESNKRNKHFIDENESLEYQQKPNEEVKNYF